jgi:hypothetical protein
MPLDQFDALLHLCQFDSDQFVTNGPGHTIAFCPI